MDAVFHAFRKIGAHNFAIVRVIILLKKAKADQVYESKTAGQYFCELRFLSPGQLRYGPNPICFDQHQRNIQSVDLMENSRYQQTDNTSPEQLDK